MLYYIIAKIIALLFSPYYVPGKALFLSHYDDKIIMG